MEYGGFAAPAGTDVRVGDILSQSVGLWRKAMPSYFLLFGFASLPNVLLEYDSSTQHIPQGAHAGAWLGLTILLSLLIGTVARGGAAAMALDIVEGRQPSLPASLDLGARSFPRLFGAQICAGFAFVFGFMLLVVPGFMLLSMWMVITPACVGECLGPIASLRRSAALTKGHRWAMFGLLLVLLVIGIAAAIVGPVAARLAGPMTSSLMQLLVTAIAGPFNEVVAVAAYASLRAAHATPAISRVGT